MPVKQYRRGTQWALLVIAAVTGFTIGTLLLRTLSTTLDAPAGAIDPATMPISEELDQTSGNSEGTVGLIYSNQIVIDLSEETAIILFANPTKSNQEATLQAVIQDMVIFQSGRIPPGYQVTRQALFPEAADKLSNGKQEGKFIVSYYEPESSNNAVVNTEIPVSVVISD